MKRTLWNIKIELCDWRIVNTFSESKPTDADIFSIVNEMTHKVKSVTIYKQD